MWITSEDNDYGWLGCYGNNQAHTPNLDELAKNGVLFRHAYSNAAVCAVARSTILNGSYAVTQGTQHMRSRHSISAQYKPYPTYLREQGYYCVNRDKTDYNFKGNDQAIWDECSAKAHYKNRPAGAPFFAVFNLLVSHESNLFDQKIKHNRNQKLIPQKPRVKPKDVALRPYLPDLPEVRNDVAVYHDCISAMDKQVGDILMELEKSGLSEDTIIFYYSDHGGVTPRGKRYLEDSGTHVPLIIHVPKKWQQLCPFKTGEQVEEMVGFVDLAPTLLSLLGQEKPKQMQGRAFMGVKRVAPAADAAMFLYADRFDEIYGMRRGLVTENGRYKYIRRFTPHLGAAPYSSYQFGQAGWRAWKKAWQEGKIDDSHKIIWQSDQVVEELFDLQSDPWEVKNLVAAPEQEALLKSLREKLKATMVESRDTGIIPEAMFAELSSGKAVSEYLDRNAGEMKAYVELAFLATDRNPKNLDYLVSGLSSASPIMRFWSCHGLMLLGKSAASSEPQLMKLLNDQSSAIRLTSACALFRMGKNDAAKNALIAELTKEKDEFALLYALNTIIYCKLSHEVPKKWIKSILNDKTRGEYLQGIASELENHYTAAQ